MKCKFSNDFTKICFHGSWIRIRFLEYNVLRSAKIKQEIFWRVSSLSKTTRFLSETTNICEFDGLKSRWNKKCLFSTWYWHLFMKKKWINFRVLSRNDDFSSKKKTTKEKKVLEKLNW